LHPDVISLAQLKMPDDEAIPGGECMAPAMALNDDLHRRVAAGVSSPLA
jgi:hypothetical protein